MHFARIDNIDYFAHIARTVHFAGTLHAQSHLSILVRLRSDVPIGTLLLSLERSAFVLDHQ